MGMSGHDTSGSGAPASTIRGLVEAAAHGRPGAPALLSPAGGTITYRDLLERMDAVAAGLAEAGVRSDDRVAICLPDGPEMACALLGISSVAATAPLNPAYSEREFDFFLGDLEPRALLLAADSRSPARLSAQRRGISILELPPDGARGIRQVERSSSAANPDPPRPPGPDSVALLLHTSGTTSRPKLVALTQGNLCVSAANVAATLGLTPADRCLNVMPLFHIHGMVAAVLASLSAGGSVACTPGFLAPLFFDWLAELSPTWYTAVPTMHQSILARAAASPEAPRHRLRFIRSASAALPPRVLAELEATFGVPVLEAYGMTEAAHQMASNPLPPARRKPGSVGIPAGPEVAVRGEDGRRVAPGERGEVVIRGMNVTRGYVANPAANAEAFVDGWFRTGDQGYFDEDGYLFLTGRLKEIVNRGGEKISPREVDEVLLEHPSVALAVAFGFPDRRLGEDLAAAVVLREGTAASERELREFASGRLADFKVPSKILIVEEIPKGPTGKLQRIGLARKLGISEEAPNPLSAQRVAPRGEREESLAAIWRDVLRVPEIGVHDDFFAVGGDSVLATQILARVEERFGVQISLIALFESRTIAHLASMLEGQEAHAEPSSAVRVAP